jgi:hypothetical protein
MKNLLFAVCVLSAATCAVAEVPAMPATPAAVDQVVSIRPFVVDEGFEFTWRLERPLVNSGVILVLKVDPALVYPRQVAQPVLYVGDTTAQCMNHGNESGYIVAIVPGDVDLTTALIWFGTPEMPEQVDADRIETERRLAERAGIKALSARAAETAAENGGGRIRVANMTELLGPIATLIENHSPAEHERVVSYRMAGEAKATR